MRRALALLRPEPGWSASAAAARRLGLEVVGHPVFKTQPLEWTVPDGRFDALLAGSAAVFRHGGAQLAALRHLPVHAVGEATAEATRAAGFRVARTGSGGLQALLDQDAASASRFLRLGGEERVTLQAHAGQTLTEIAIYRMRPEPLAEAFAAILDRAAPLVALHSAAAARHFRGETARLGLTRGRLFLIALGPRIAKAAGPGWGAVHLADRPDDEALLVKAAALCK